LNRLVVCASNGAVSPNISPSIEKRDSISRDKARQRSLSYAVEKAFSISSPAIQRPDTSQWIEQSRPTCANSFIADAFWEAVQQH